MSKLGVKTEEQRSDQLIIQLNGNKDQNKGMQSRNEPPRLGKGTLALKIYYISIPFKTRRNYNNEI